MRIGIDARLWAQTGVGRYIRNLTVELQKIDTKNDYVLFLRTEDLEDAKSKLSNPKWRAVAADIKWHSLSEQTKFPKLLNKENLDLVHFPYFSVPVFYKKPYVVTIHDLIINHFPTGKASTLSLPLYQFKLLGYKYVIKKAAGNSKKIIAVSKATKDEIIDHLGVNSDKISVIYNGIDNGIVNKKSEIKEENYRKYFLYVGNAYPHKNLEKALEAFQKFSSENKEIKFIMVGKEDYFYKRLKEKISGLGLEDKVTIKESFGDLELSNLYKNAIALLMPSLMEGFGLPALEAMANGCPVLASDIPSLKEICKDAALYFNPHLSQGIFESLELISKDNQLGEKLIKQGLIRAKEFSWEKAAKETLEVYEKAI